MTNKMSDCWQKNTMLSVAYFTQLVLSPFFPPVSSLCPFLFSYTRRSLQKHFFSLLAWKSQSLYQGKLSRRWLQLCIECRMDFLIELNARKKKKHFPRCRTIPSTSKDRFCYNTVFLNDRSRRSKISTLPSTKNKPVFLSTTAVTDRVYTTPPK